MIRSRIFLAAAALLMWAAPAFAQSEGPNGHYYQVVLSLGLTWEQAVERASNSTFNGRHGHLATITSPEEDAFIETLRQQAMPGGFGSLWVGGSQLASAAGPMEDWFWINGEGAIPMNGDNNGHANWQQGEPNDYSGPQSEQYLSIGHFNQPGWNDEPAGNHIYGYVVEYPGSGRKSTVRVQATDFVAIETSGQPNTASFRFTREGDLSGDLPVFFSIHGTARNGVDYNEISRTIIIPSGQSATTLEIVPRPDALAVVEPMETVGIRLERSLIITPESAYDIDPANREAAVVIFEGQAPAGGAISIGIPRDGTTYAADELVTILAVASSVQPVTFAEFFADNVKLGTATRSALSDGLSYFKFTWTNPPAGIFRLNARATIDGQLRISEPIHITTPAPPARATVSITYEDGPSVGPVPVGDHSRGFFKVSRSSATPHNLIVYYSVSGTATAGSDYEALPGYVVIPAGRTSALFGIVAKDDSIDEPTETVVLTLIPAEGPMISDQYDIDPAANSATAPIFDDDEPATVPQVGVIAVHPQTSEPLPTALILPGLFRIVRTGPSEQSLPVSLQIQGTAHPGVDYNRLPASVTFAPGQTEIDLQVFALNDNLVEGVETVTVEIRVEGRYTIDPNAPRAAVFIHDADSNGQASIQITAPQDGELFRAGASILIEAVAVDPDGYVPRVEFYANETKIGESAIEFLVPPPNGTPIEHRFRWNDVPEGSYRLTARGYSVPRQHLLLSVPVRIQVGGGENIPVISIDAEPIEISEPAPAADPILSRVTVSRTGSLEYPQRVYLRYAGTAQAGRDYTPSMPEVVIPAGDSKFEFVLRSSSDALAEGTETALVRIGPPLFPANPDPANRLYEINPEKRAVEIDILDANGPSLPVVSIHSILPRTHEPLPNMDVAPAVFAVRRTGSTASPLTVNLNYGGTATAGADYPTPSPTIQFSAGQAEVRVEIYAHDDDLVEGQETILVSLRPVLGEAPERYEIDPNHKQVSLVIEDNDQVNAPPVVRIETIDPAATEHAAPISEPDTARFVITRDTINGNLTQPLVVFFSVHGTAQNGQDYERLPQYATIPPGQNNVVIEVTPLSDFNLPVHQYEIVEAPGISWEDARHQAETGSFNGFKSYLATITSAEEDTRIEQLRQEKGAGVLWVGGYQEPGEQSVTGGWKWVNEEGPIPGDNFSGGYANWLDGEPNDYWGPATENHMVIGWLNSFGWNDQAANGAAQGYVVEVEIPTPVAPEPEKMETVALRLEPSPQLSPLPAYQIDPQQRTAAAVIFDQEPPSKGRIEVAFPSAGFEFALGEPVQFLVAAFHPSDPIEEVLFAVDNTVLGESERVTDPIQGVTLHYYDWEDAFAGPHMLYATVYLPDEGDLYITPTPFRIGSGGANQPPVVQIETPADGAVFLEGARIAIKASASDPDGRVSRIDLLIDGTEVATAEGGSVAFTWENPPVGPHIILARARDNLDALGFSPEVRVLVRHRDSVAFVERQLPAGYSPGVPFSVQLRAVPPSGTHAYAVEDRIPIGWIISEASHNGFLDVVTGKVKFGPFSDGLPRTLTYRLTPPAHATGRQEFSGQASANGAVYPITGQNTIGPVQQHHPADRDQNFVITLAEVTAYTAAWKSGATWPTGPNPIPVSYVTTAGSIWNRGEAYIFNPNRPAPDCWAPRGQIEIAALAVGQPGAAQRSISGELQPGVAATVQVAVTPPSAAACFAVEEKPPRGWTVSEISHEGVFDAQRGVIRWGAFMDHNPRVLTYKVTPPASVAAVGTFSGQLSADGQSTEISAPRASFEVDGPAPMEIIRSIATPDGVNLTISGPSGQTAVIEASSDLVNWNEVKSLFVPTGTVEVNAGSAEGSQRFYRLRVQ